MPAATPYIPTITIDAVIDALVVFLQPFAAGSQIVRGQGNRVPPPVTAYIVLTEMNIMDLETPSVTNDAANAQVGIFTPAQIDIQVDFYGPSSGDQCKAVKSVFRSVYAPSQFPDNIKPLFCSDGHQSPLVTGEEQYESRWTLTASLQYNPVVSVPQQFADELAVASIEEI